MALRQEKLDVYRLAIGYVARVYEGESEEACAAETESVDPDSDLDGAKPQQGDGI